MGCSAVEFFFGVAHFESLDIERNPKTKPTGSVYIYDI